MRFDPSKWLAEWPEAEGDRLPLWLPVFMGAGVAFYYAIRFEPPLWIGGVAAVTSLAAAIWVAPARRLLAPLAAVALGFAAGQIATARAPPLEADLPPHAAWVTGPVIEIDVLPEGRRIVIQPALVDDGDTPLTRTVTEYACVPTTCQRWKAATWCVSVR